MTCVKEKVAFITGASKGIGAGIAKAFAKEGACLSLVATGSGGPKEFDDVVQQCKDLGAKDVLKICIDLSEKENMEMAVNITIDKFGRLDVLVNNAAIICMGSIEEVKLEEFDKIMKLNTRTPLYLTQLAIPYLEKTKGNIVNISSINSTTSSITFMVAYNLSKAALDQLTRITALDLAKKGIRVNTINPGCCETPILKTFAKLCKVDLEAVKESAAAKHPLGGEIIEPENIADAVIFLSSDEARMITGVTLPVDCGRLLTGQ